MRTIFTVAIVGVVEFAKRTVSKVPRRFPTHPLSGISSTRLHWLSKTLIYMLQGSSRTIWYYHALMLSRTCHSETNHTFHRLYIARRVDFSQIVPAQAEYESDPCSRKPSGEYSHPQGIVTFGYPITFRRRPRVMTRKRHFTAHSNVRQSFGGARHCVRHRYNSLSPSTINHCLNFGETDILQEQDHIPTVRVH